MKLHIITLLLLIFTMESECSTDDRFFISGPNVFHVGVNEKVFVQLGRRHLNNPVTLYLEHETCGTIVSETKTVWCTHESETKTVELMINRKTFSEIPERCPRHYFSLVAESPSMSGRKLTRVLVSKHRGYIFIQTNQPMYNPTQKVHYRIFTLDHTLRPHQEAFQISVFNAAGNRILKSLKTAKSGILKGSFDIPDVSKMGTWKITAHYEGDEENAVSREFKVQRFVLPSFEVNIATEHNYILLSAEEFVFTISAIYSRGDKVKGAYHCQFGVVYKKEKNLIRGLEETGSIESGSATVHISTAKIKEQLKNQTLSNLQQKGAKLYLKVFVTNIQSGEMQQAEVELPVISHKYTMDLSRTRSYFVPGYPLDVVVVMRLPDGSPAAGVPIKIDVQESSEKSLQENTNQDGTVFRVFNIQAPSQITVKVTADGVQQSKVIRSISSPSHSYLYLGFTNKVYSVNDLLTITFNTRNGAQAGFIYYMVLSRGIIIKHDHLTFGTSVKHNLRITSDLVPSFRLIGYFYNQQGDVIADSVWVDVRDECEIKVEMKHNGEFEPGKQARLDFDLHGQRATVALLSVDKAFYALKADNKLTAKQVFSTMQSYDLGCSYGGGADSPSVLIDAGLSFVSQVKSDWRKDINCDSRSARRTSRSADLQQEMMAFKSNFSDETLQECCVQGFSLIPMTLTCEERAKRVSVMKNQACADAFLQCCLKGEDLRQKKIREDAKKGFGRTASTADIEEFFLEAADQYIRRLFPPSFAFTEFDVNDKKSYYLALPDSITTWEIQVITLSPDTGFCVVNPSEVKAVKRTFVSLRLPDSVKKYEQLSISPVIYNYGDKTLQLAVHMEQTEGLCSPGSATTTGFVNITVEGRSAQFVTFSAVPMVTGSIPIKIRLYDIENENGIDAVQKALNVRDEGFEQRVERTKWLKLDGRRTETLHIDGTIPDDTVPDSTSNIFISVEGNGFGTSFVKNLISPEKVFKLIVLPNGCLEQTMTGLAPTVFAVRYLDLSEQWFHLPAGSRDDALDKIEHGFGRILGFKKKEDGSYGAWSSVPSSNWVTALVVKVLSMVAERQIVAFGLQGRQARIVPVEEIRHPVSFLLSVQNSDGSFTDPQPVLHRGVLKGKDQDASLTAFITLALNRSLQFLQDELRSEVETRISKSTVYLQSHLEELQHPYAVAVVAYCLSVCMPEGTDHSATWTKLQALATKDKNGCYLWSTDASKNQEDADAITVETSAYALLTAAALGKAEQAKQAACWLITQENYSGGFKSTQDTIMALQALSEYELFVTTRPEANVIAEFTVPGRKDIVNLALENNNDKVERDLKKLAGNNIVAQLTGKGEVKLKVVKAYYLLDPKDTCQQLSINVTVEGKVKYTTKIAENYEYYDDYDNIEQKELRVPRSAVEEFDAQPQNRRDIDNDLSSEEITYTVCVGHNPDYQLTGMAIADITLLSGFEAVTEHLDGLKQPPEQYISHYEVSYGRVLIYFNELIETKECIRFDAIQRVPIGLLQPAPAVFYDYYEPATKCTVFYSAPQRSKMVSKLCSEDVCQCAERPCHKPKITFKLNAGGRGLTKNDRVEHACFFPTVDYAYMVEVISVSVKSNFDLYRTKVTEVLRSHGDIHVSGNSVRVFAKRRQCKEDLEVGIQYLIMGKDGTTTDSNGAMQYLLESNTWVEKRPSDDTCKKSDHRPFCTQFLEFIQEYKVDGCRQ